MKQNPAPGVYIEDVFGLLHTASMWDSSKIVNSIVVSTQNRCFRMAPIVLRMPLYIGKTDGYGNTIGFSDSDLSMFIQYPTAAAAATCFNGEKDTYLLNMLYTKKQNTVDMAYILGDAPVFCYNYRFKKGGNGYLMSSGEALLIQENIDVIQQAYSAIGINLSSSPLFWTSTFVGKTSRGLNEFWTLYSRELSIGGYNNNVCDVIPIGLYY